MGRIVEVHQGLAVDGRRVPRSKSSTQDLVGHVADYFDPYTYSLGMGGSMTVELSFGASAIRIFEESFLKANQFDPEDAMVEVSVDEITFFPDATSLLQSYTVLAGGGGHIHYTDIELPNDACYTFIKLTDTSDPDSYNCNGFDLISIEVIEPCCSIIKTTKSETPRNETPIPFLEFFQFASTESLIAFGVAVFLLSLLCFLLALTFYNCLRKKLKVKAILEAKVVKEDKSNVKNVNTLNIHL